jgi:hypothetical protein
MVYFMSIMPSLLAAVLVLLSQQPNVQAASAIDLGNCVDFAVMGGTAVSFNGVTTGVTVGSVGVSPGVSISGSYVVGLGSVEANTAASISCASSMLTAYNAAAAETCTNTATPADLSGLTLTAGVYCNDGGLFSLSTGSLTLSGSATDVWIFQAATSITTSSDTSIILSGGALASNVFWKAGTTVTTGVSSTFVGTILSGTSVTLGSTSSLNGRAFAQAAVSASSGNTITSFVNGYSDAPSKAPTATVASSGSTSTSSLSGGSVAAIVIMSLIALIGILGAAYCGIMHGKSNQSDESGKNENEEVRSAETA